MSRRSDPPPISISFISVSARRSNNEWNKTHTFASLVPIDPLTDHSFKQTASFRCSIITPLLMTNFKRYLSLARVLYSQHKDVKCVTGINDEGQRNHLHVDQILYPINMGRRRIGTILTHYFHALFYSILQKLFPLYGQKLHDLDGLSRYYSTNGGFRLSRIKHLFV